ncbi:hypothetical protein CRENBAI_008009, partial [Crenichthys baileyi]
GVLVPVYSCQWVRGDVRSGKIASSSQDKIQTHRAVSFSCFSPPVFLPMWFSSYLPNTVNS